MRLAPGVAIVLAGIALLTALTSPALGAVAVAVLAGVIGADALAVRRAPEVRRQVPEPLARRVAARPRAESERAGLGRVGLRQPAPAALELDPREADGELDATL